MLRNQNAQESSCTSLRILYQRSVGLCMHVFAWCRNADTLSTPLPSSPLSPAPSQTPIDRSIIEEAIKERDDDLKKKVRYHFLNPRRKLDQRRKNNGIRSFLHLKNLIKVVLHIILFALVTTQVSGDN